MKYSWILEDKRCLRERDNVCVIRQTKALRRRWLFSSAHSKIFTGSSTRKVAIVNVRDDIVRLQELNLGLRLPHGRGAYKTGVQLFRYKRFVDSDLQINVMSNFYFTGNKYNSSLVSHLGEEIEAMRAFRAHSPVRYTSSNGKRGIVCAAASKGRIVSRPNI